MRVERRELSARPMEPELTLILVQLRSPFFRFNEGRSELFLLERELDSVFEWRNRAFIANRITKILSILEKLRARNPAPNLIVFPEYSVPKQAHDELQNYADSNECIIVPGSYFETQQSEEEFGTLYRNNVCRIYIPHQKPLTIVKKNPYEEFETAALAVNPNAPNIARLIWRRADGAASSINIFLCRNFLSPYDEKRVSVLDWDREGLNVVVMNSPEASMFEHEAAKHIRRLLGRRKIVALCNCSDTGSRFGSSVLAPAHTRERGDVVASLPPDEEGLIEVQTRLQNIKYTRDRPDPETTEPLKRITPLLMRMEGDATAVRFVEPEKEARPAVRGVWHPSFLEVIEREVHVDLYLTRKLQTAQSVFKRRINHVYAATLRGMHDVMIRRYAGGSERNIQSPVPLTFPYSSLEPADFRELFVIRDEHQNPRQQRLVISPRDTIKYRQVNIVEEDWDQHRREIERLLVTSNRQIRSRRIRTICRLAQDWFHPDVTHEERREVMGVFFEEQEEVVPLGRGAESEYREAYILVAPIEDDPTNVRRFEREYIRAKLVPTKEIRSIYRIRSDSGQVFRWLLDTIATPRRTDEIIANMRIWAEVNRIQLGTRSFEIMDYLKTDAIDGIIHTDFGKEVANLFALKHKFGADRLAESADGPHTSDTADGRDINNLGEDEFRTSLVRGCGNALFRQVGMEPAISKDLWDRYKENISAFYWRFYRANEIENERRYFEDAASTWAKLFKPVEDVSEGILTHITGSKNRRELDHKIARLLDDLIEKPSSLHRQYPTQLLVLFGNSTQFSAYHERARQARSAYEKYTRPLRNEMSHGFKEMRETLNLREGDFQTKMEKISEATGSVIELLGLVTEWERQVTAGPGG